MISVCVRSRVMRVLDRRLLRISKILTLIALSLLSIAPAPAFAQIRLDGINLSGDYAVCADAAGIFVPEDDDCEAPLIGPGDDVFPISGITIGPPGSQTNFRSATGAATFGGGATFNSPATFNGSVSMSGNRIQNVGDPLDPTDAANKRYVDDQNATQNTRMTTIEGVNTQQDARLTSVETVNTQQDTRITTTEIVNAQQDTRLNGLEETVADQGAQIDVINNKVGQLRERDRELADGIAIALALDQPIFQSGQQFAMRVGWGNFDGSDAVGVSAAGLLARGAYGSTVVLDAGIGASTSQDMVGGRAGLTFGW